MTTTTAGFRSWRTATRALAAVAFAATSALTLGGPVSAAHADNGYAAVSGAGSTWAEVAIDAWRADVRANGLVVNYDGTGDSDGRREYIQATADFAAAQIPFENPPEPGQAAEVPNRPYAYLPIVAGGTAFMYHVTVGGQLVRNLRLDGSLLAKIFTGAITSWSDPAIAADNPGVQLPSEPIIPVIRSDGSGASAQFSLYLSKQYPSIWCPFEEQNLGVSANQCGLTSFYPTFGNAKAQSGANGIANYVSASYGEGTIGYDEYAYAKRINYPVASLLNAGGYYAQPTAGNVAVALTSAVIDPTTLLQNLDSVYTNPDPRTYPLSSYAYFIVPTSTDSPFTTDKGRSLSTYINYFLCGGQQKADVLGYSPLPTNLVQAGFTQVAKIPGNVASPSIASCNNPALQILQTAPQPDACARQGAAATCGTTAAGAAAGGAATTAKAGAARKSAAVKSSSAKKGTAAAAAGPAVAGGAPQVDAAGVAGAGAAGVTSSAGAAGSTGAEPGTGSVTGTPASATTTAANAGAVSATGAAAAAAPGAVTLTTAAAAVLPDAQPPHQRSVALGALAVLVLLGAVTGPPFLVRYLRQRAGAP